MEEEQGSKKVRNNKYIHTVYTLSQKYTNIMFGLDW